MISGTKQSCKLRGDSMYRSSSIEEMIDIYLYLEGTEKNKRHPTFQLDEAGEGPGPGSRRQRSYPTPQRLKGKAGDGPGREPGLNRTSR